MKVAVIYASTTGNTEAMAKAIQDGLTSGGAQVSLLKAGSVSASDAAGYDMLILGSPAMGAEVLEEEEMEPFFSSIEPSLSGKKVALFGSYDWGDGEWMRTWEDRVRSAGAKLFKDAGLIVHLTPEAEDIEKCTAFGKEAAAF
ncbi:MAG: flavodoxin [Treponema lecithinolyticum]|jgi:flavodoxin|uniref:flavodoxin n=1 Tax=Treponema lecithinolyticum TaxID=53418 RepID=UPI003FA2C2F7